jgi:putative acetyltransferase
MYVRPEFRGRGNGVTLLRLETGIHKRAAIRLYERLGFRRIPPFGPYTDDPLSRCYENHSRLPSATRRRGLES